MKFKIPTHDPYTGELNPHYEELTGEKHPHLIDKDKPNCRFNLKSLIGKIFKPTTSEVKTPTRITFSPTPKCLICKTDMETIKLNQPFCGECLSVLTGLVKNKKDE